MHINMYEYVYVCSYMYMYMHMHIYICARICIIICMCMCNPDRLDISLLLKGHRGRLQNRSWSTQKKKKK